MFYIEYRSHLVGPFASHDDAQRKLFHGGKIVETSERELRAARAYVPDSHRDCVPFDMGH